MMDSYSFLANSYDALTTDVHYKEWADFLEKQWKKTELDIHTVLDLACGTGSLTKILAERGYEMIGVDQSSEMLAEAYEKNADVDGIMPIFLAQKAENLDLYGTIDACVSCLDSMNYITNPQKLKKAMERVHLFLNPGGLFVFDIVSEDRLKSLDGQVFLDETEDTYCIWRAEYSPKSRICTYGMDIFRKEGKLWRRGEEIHREYAYTQEEITEYLAEAGFDKIWVYGDKKARKPKEKESRIFFIARKDEM